MKYNLTCKKYIWYRLLIIGTFIGLSGMLIATLMDTFAAFLPIFSIGFGVCNGITYLIPLHHSWLWFPDRPGLISGIIVSGFGIGTFAFNELCIFIVNPDNEKAEDGSFPKDVNDRVPRMMYIFFGCRCILAILSVLTIFEGREVTS